MMAIELPQHFISSYVAAMVGTSPALFKITSERTTTIKEQINNGNNKAPTFATHLSDQHYNDMLNGPFSSFYQLCTHSTATLNRLAQQIVIHNEDLFSEVRLDHEQQPDNPFNLIASGLLKNHSASTTDKLKSSLDTLITEQNSAWQEKIDQWTLTALQQFSSLAINIDHSEQDEFNLLYPISELLDRLTDLKITPPKINKKEGITFENYFRLKAKLLLSNAFAKAQKTKTDKELNKVINQFKATFQLIGQESDALLANQAKAHEALIEPVAFAKVNQENWR